MTLRSHPLLLTREPHFYLFLVFQDFQSLTGMTLSRWKSLQRNRNEADPHFVRGQPGSAWTEPHQCRGYQSQARCREDAEAPRKGPETPWAVLESEPRGKFPVPCWASTVGPSEVPWTHQGLRNLVSSWHTHHVPGKVGNCLGRGEEKAFEDARQCPQQPRQGFPLLLSDPQRRKDLA